jgi:hypothetical protein
MIIGLLKCLCCSPGSGPSVCHILNIGRFSNWSEEHRPGFDRKLHSYFPI